MFWKKRLTTEQKADLLGERLLGAVPEVASFILSKLDDTPSVQVTERNREQLLIELFVFYMHILDRMAFRHLGPSGRDVFAERLANIVAAAIAESQWVNASRADGPDRFQSTYNERQLEYANYKEFYPQGQEPWKDTLFWECGKILFGLTASHNPVDLTLLAMMVMDWTPVLLGKALMAEETLKG
jgi:hypothetical protein